MTSNEFTCKVLKMAEEMIERCKSAREEVISSEGYDLGDPDLTWELGYQYGVEKALYIITGLENILTDIANVEKTAKMKKQSLEGEKRNA